MEIVTFANIKGGIGKTTLSYNFGEYLAFHGNKVLFMDLDQQSSLSRNYKGITEDQKHSVEAIFNIYNFEKVEPKIWHVKKNIDIISGTSRLDKIQSQLVTYSNKYVILYQWLQRHYDDVVAKYDYMIIDCHPDLGIATSNAVVVSDAIFAPVKPEKYSFDSLKEFKDRLSSLKQEVVNIQTGESLIKAKTYFIGNAIRKVDVVRKAFTHMIESEMESAKKNNLDDNLWICKIPEWILFTVTASFSMPLCEMEKIAITLKKDLTQYQQNDMDFMSKRKYFKNQSKAKFEEVNNIFETLKKYA